MQWHKAVQWPSGCNWPHACQCHLCWHAKASGGQRWYILPGHLRGQPRTVHPFPQKVPDCGEPASFHLKKKEKKKLDDRGIILEFLKNSRSAMQSTSVSSNSTKLGRGFLLNFFFGIIELRYWNIFRYSVILKIRYWTFSIFNSIERYYWYFR